MIQYSFPQFKTVIVNPTITNIKAHDNFSAKECIVTCVLVDPSGSSFGISIPIFKYDETWTDQDIHQHIENELKNFVVQ